MALIDSVPQFVARLKELELNEFADKFKSIGATTMATLAFCVDYIPGASNPDVFTKEVLIPVLGSATHEKRAAVRRLFSEAYALSAADLRRRTEPKTDDAVSEMPLEERESRRDVLEKKLNGLTLTGELDPSHRLVNLAYQMYEKNVVVYLDWSKLTKRDQELQDIREIRTWKADANGIVRETKEIDHVTANYDSDMLLEKALKRRGLALDIANVCSYNVHDLWVQVLFDALHRTPLPGFGKVTTQQLRNADVELWRMVSERCRRGIRVEADGGRPVDTAIKELMFAPEVRFLLMPAMAKSHPHAGGGNAGSSNDHTRSNDANSDATSRDRKRIRELEQQLNSVKKQRMNQGGGKSKGRGKRGANREIPMPAGLLGKNAKTAAGDPICFNFNLAGCNQAGVGGRCPKGLHVCAEPGCGRAHPLKEHRA